MHFRKIILLKRLPSTGYLELSFKMRKEQGHLWIDKITPSKAQRHEKNKKANRERNTKYKYIVSTVYKKLHSDSTRSHG